MTLIGTLRCAHSTADFTKKSNYHASWRLLPSTVILQAQGTQNIIAVLLRLSISSVKSNTPALFISCKLRMLRSIPDVVSLTL